MVATTLLIVLILSFVGDLLKRIGSIAEATWQLYLRLPSTTSTTMKSQRQLQSEIVQIRTEMSNTSSQDEFAKWAKLRREHDKKLAQVEKLAGGVSVSRAKFDGVIRVLQWILTNGLGLVMMFWWRKEAMFWLPGDWWPWGVEWVVSWPKAPMGSVSINMWSLCCGMLVKTVVDLIMSLRSPTAQSQKPQLQAQPQPQPMKAQPMKTM